MAVTAAFIPRIFSSNKVCGRKAHTWTVIVKDYRQKRNANQDKSRTGFCPSGDILRPAPVNIISRGVCKLLTGKSWGSFILSRNKSTVPNRNGHHIHSENNIRLVLPVRCNVGPKLSEDFVARATLSDDLLWNYGSSTMSRAWSPTSPSYLA